MSEIARNFFVGLSTIVGLCGLAVLLMYFGEFRPFRPAEYAVNVRMTMAGGIREGSPIELDGVPIGRIVSIDLDRRDPQFPVLGHGRVRSEYRIPTDFVATVERSLLAGTAILNLTSPRPEPDETVAFLPTDGTAVMAVEVRTVLEQVMVELDARTEPLIEALDNFNQLSRTYTAVGDNINALIGELGMDPDEGEPTVRTAVLRLNEVLGEASSALRLANVWLEDEQLRADFTGAVANANSLIENATATVSRYGRLAESLEDDAATLVRNLIPVTDEMAGTLADVRRLTALATEGRGTVAQLLNNPDLYESLLDAAIRLERALTEAQLLIQKFQAEGVPIRW